MTPWRTRGALLTACVLALALGGGSCDCDCDQRTRGRTHMLLEPPEDRSSLNEGELTVRDLMDIVRHYFPPITVEEIRDEEAMAERWESEQYKLWAAMQLECGERRREWHALIEEVREELPAYEMRSDTWPRCSSHEALIWRKDDPPLSDGITDTSLIVRASLLAPVWEAYETSSVIRMVGPKRDRVRYTERRRTHDVSAEFEPAAKVFGRAINARRGPHQRLYADVTGIRMLHTLDWHTGWNRSNLGELLFSEYVW